MDYLVALQIGNFEQLVINNTTTKTSLLVSFMFKINFMSQVNQCILQCGVSKHLLFLKHFWHFFFFDGFSKLCGACAGVRGGEERVRGGAGQGARLPPPQVLVLVLVLLILLVLLLVRLIRI